MRAVLKRKQDLRLCESIVVAPGADVTLIALDYASGGRAVLSGAAISARNTNTNSNGVRCSRALQSARVALNCGRTQLCSTQQQQQQQQQQQPSQKRCTSSALGWWVLICVVICVVVAAS